MAVVKTAVSLDRDLFERVEALAREMKVSRSRLLAMALEDYLGRRENQRLLERINAAYEDSPTDSERELLGQMQRVHRRIVEGEW